MAPFSSPLDYLGRVRRVNDKPLRGRFASLDTAATARGMAAIEGDGEDQRSLAATRGQTDPRCPGGLGGVGVAEQPQLAVGHGPDAGAADRAEGGEGLVPGGPLVGVWWLGSGPIGSSGW
jgi:hypothetical protein